MSIVIFYFQTDILYLDSSLIMDEDINEHFQYFDPWKKRALIYMALICVGVLIALGTMSYWHFKLISNGETSIEANINKAETLRLLNLGKTYRNPYDFGTKKNWKLFLGLVNGRSVLIYRISSF